MFEKVHQGCAYVDWHHCSLEKAVCSRSTVGIRVSARLEATAKALHFLDKDDETGEKQMCI